MSACKYLSGENVAPLTKAKAVSLIGRRISYLRRCDIDTSGRGYFFPREGVVLGEFRRHIELDCECNYLPMSDFLEVVDMGDEVSP